MSQRSELQDQIRILDNHIRSLDVEIGNVQTRLANSRSQGQSKFTIEGWTNDLKNKKDKREEYKARRREYQSKLRNC